MTPRELADVSRMSVSELSELLVAKMWEEHTRTISENSPSQSSHERVRKVLQLHDEHVLYLESIRQCVAGIGAQTRRFSNKQSLLLRMPEEIILNIVAFYVCAVDCVSEVKSVPYPIPYYSFQRLVKLLSITHICFELRQMCNCSAHLWTKLDLSWPPALIETFAERAQNASLSLRLPILFESAHTVPGFFRRMLEFLPHFLNQKMHRLRELRLVFSDWQGGGAFNYQKIWNAIKDLPAPILEVFELSTSSIFQEFRPDHFFGNQAPLLRSIELESCWNQNVNLRAFASLVSLRLELTDPQLILSQLRTLPTTLSHCPGLEVLRLYGSQDDTDLVTDPVAPAIQPMVELEHCISLTMGDFTSDAIVFFLSAVSFPALRHISVQGAASTTFPFPRLHSTIPSSLKSQCSSASRLKFDLYHGKVGAEMRVPKSSVYVAEHGLRSRSSEAQLNMVNRLLTAPSHILQARPRYLSFSGDDWETLPEDVYTKETWMEVLSSYPSVQRISLSGKIKLASFLAVLNSREMCCPELMGMKVAVANRVGDDDWHAIETLLHHRPNLREVIVDESEQSQSDSE
ncbi:hypothetical protein SISNIDRAFT_488024 [Sistotremastrum niveocremeum HHB9708]|uniref:F-box domain-containing protein n=1 Tax=Sistotremastrum niveocremeum HHB9708 TaxID=1314777 RepID=A0A164RNE3_9AGAM|nr:hypothetical protein SISNIDRAFT_488024 [Sistotremastrum niveocremeum HHB9708]